MQGSLYTVCSGGQSITNNFFLSICVNKYTLVHILLKERLCFDDERGNNGKKMIDSRVSNSSSRTEIQFSFINTHTRTQNES